MNLDFSHLDSSIDTNTFIPNLLYNAQIGQWTVPTRTLSANGESIKGQAVDVTAEILYEEGGPEKGLLIDLWSTECGRMLFAPNTVDLDLAHFTHPFPKPTSYDLSLKERGHKLGFRVEVYFNSPMANGEHRRYFSQKSKTIYQDYLQFLKKTLGEATAPEQRNGQLVPHVRIGKFQNGQNFFISFQLVDWVNRPEDWPLYTPQQPSAQQQPMQQQPMQQQPMQQPMQQQPMQAAQGAPVDVDVSQRNNPNDGLPF